jgi:hypothetical protein
MINYKEITRLSEQLKLINEFSKEVHDINRAFLKLKYRMDMKVNSEDFDKVVLDIMHKTDTSKEFDRIDSQMTTIKSGLQTVIVILNDSL